MTPELATLARKYVWWEPPERALARQAQFLCQLMQLGTWEDVQATREHFGDAAFKEALATAPPGVLDAKSWNYWHLFFGVQPVPRMPSRLLP